MKTIGKMGNAIILEDVGEVPESDIDTVGGYGLSVLMN